MSSDYDKASVDTSSSKRGLGIIDTLQNLRQNVETVVRQSRFEISGSSVDQIDAPEELDEYVDEAKKVGFVWKALQVFANDVWEPGYRFEGPDETIAYFMGESEDLDAQPPENTPEGGFLKNCAVYAGEKQQDFYDYGKQTTFQRWLRGTVITELLKADSENPESEITGFYFVRPETLSAEVYPNTNILIEPDDTEQPGVEVTKRGEAAAYIQFDDQSILGRRGKFDNDRDEVPLSQNDVQKQVLNPGIGDDAEGEQGVFGTSAIEPIAEDLSEYRQIKRDRAVAIGNKSHGIWLIEHGRDVIELPNGNAEIIEWDDDSMDDFEDQLADIDPGGYVTYDGSVTPERVDGDVPDLADVIDDYINTIIASLPTPKYKIGFEDNINRDVTSEQSTDYDRFISEEREYQERQWTQTFREIANRAGLPTEGLKLKIEPEPSDSPIKSLTQEEIDKIATYADALNSLAGPTGGPQTLVDVETLLTDVAQLPESTAEDVAGAMEEMEETDQPTETLFNEYMGIDPLQAFDDSEVVETPDGLGAIDDIITAGTVDGMDATEDDPIYAVVVEDEDIGVGFYSEDELSSGDIGDLPGPENPEEDIGEGEEQDTEAKQDLYQDGFFEWPQSWVDSNTPARLIALKAWSGMGASFDGCVREMRGNLTGSPERFCADFKDRLYGTETWRGGWAD